MSEAGTTARISIKDAYARAVRLYQGRQPRRALRLAQEIAARQPRHPGARHLLGVLLMQEGDLQAAEDHLRKATELVPDQVSFRNTLGLWHMNAEHFDEAYEIFQSVRRAQPDFVPVYTNLGLLSSRRGELEEAERWHREALRRRDDYTPALNNLGNALRSQERLAEADEVFTRALEIDPQNPEIRSDRGMCRLQAGNFAAGWTDYEARVERRTERGRHRSLRLPVWDGTPRPDSALVVHQEQGHGDVIQCARFLRDARTQVARLIVVVPTPLVRLVGSVEGVDHVCDRDRDELPGGDLKLPIFSLPHRLGIGRDTIRAEVPYINVVPESALERTPGRKLAVGLCWSGKTENRDSRRRSMSVEALAPLLDTDGVEFFSLQYGADALPASGEQLDGRIRYLDREALGDFYRTAGIMQQLDLIITVDTVTAHLAGALGLPVWLMLNRGPDWRWGLAGESTPWYPTMRIFRQRVRGDWASVVESIAQALRERIALDPET